MAPNDLGLTGDAVRSGANPGDGDASADSQEQPKFKPSLKSIIGVGLIMCIVGAFTMNSSGNASGKGRGYSYADDEAGSAQDPEYLKIKGRRAENVRSGRGILYSIFCRGNQRSEYCSRH